MRAMSRDSTEPLSPKGSSPSADWALLFEEEAERLWRALFGYTGSREVASDSVSEAFTQLIRRGSAVREPRAWLWKAGYRIARGEIQRERISGPAAEGGSYEMDSAESVDLMAALGSLPEKQRASVILYYVAGYDTGQIARIIGSSSGAVRVHMFRARKTLKERISHDFE